jgi:hypothetical protein
VPGQRLGGIEVEQLRHELLGPVRDLRVGLHRPVSVSPSSILKSAIQSPALASSQLAAGPSK